MDSQLEGFRDVVEYCNFQDLGFQGYLFTWSNGHEGDANIQLRLDWALGIESLLLQFPYYKVVHGARSGSDHSSLIISLDSESESNPNVQKLFHFDECWTKEPECEEHIKDAWRKKDDLLENLQRVKRRLCGSKFMGIKDFKKHIQNI